MDTATKISVESAATANDVLANAMAIICGLGLVMLACMATNGLDLSVGFF
jgi:ribose/xylose/arabinose/galactoside ABC-type transport system permease subunit